VTDVLRDSKSESTAHSIPRRRVGLVLPDVRLVPCRPSSDRSWRISAACSYSKVSAKAEHEYEHRFAEYEYEAPFRLSNQS
jgi:hypothetical protein